MTAKELRAAEARYQRAAKRLEQARADRDEAIRATIATGTSHAEVARILGNAISRTRIGQIAITTDGPAMRKEPRSLTTVVGTGVSEERARVIVREEIKAAMKAAQR